MAQESKDARTVLGTGGDRHPVPLAPTAAFHATCALCHFAIQVNESNRLFGWIVRDIDARVLINLDVFESLLAKTVSQVLRVMGDRHSPHRLGAEYGTFVFQDAVEFGFNIVLVAAMNNGEHVLQGLRLATTVGSFFDVQMGAPASASISARSTRRQA